MIAVCTDTGCRACDSVAVYEAFAEAVKNHCLEGEVEVKATGCLGFCEIGALVIILPEKIVYGNINPKHADEIIVKTIVKGMIIDKLLYRDPGTKKRIPIEGDIPFFSKQKRVITGDNSRIDPDDITDYIALGGYQAARKVLESMRPSRVIDMITRSGLRGRGGGGFPAGVKWQSARKAKGDRTYVICNADEGDPGAFMDRSICEGNPHSILEGMIIGAYAVGSNEGFIYVRDEYPLAVEVLTTAIDQARRCGLLGCNILGSGFDFDISISRGGGAFVGGESTALMASLEGRVSEPRAKYVHTVERGLYNQPTVLNNVETWANVPKIILNGVSWFTSMGTGDVTDDPWGGSKGTKVFSLVGNVVNTGLVEVPMGITLREIIFDIGGGVPDGKKFKAVQTGGPSGGCLPEELLDLPVDFDQLTKAGSMMGSGGMIVMDEDTCVVDVAKYFIDFLKEESCGKCLPCREGLRALLEILTRITEGKGKRGDITLLEEVSETVIETSLCALGGSAPNPVLSTIRYFRDEYVEHIRSKKCRAGICKALVSYRIVPENCTGCHLCVKACPVDCISGEPKKLHTLDADVCVKCGACYQVCKFDAIER
jgi:NADH-quinone oxidoreductase subunit F